MLSPYDRLQSPHANRVAVFLFRVVNCLGSRSGVDGATTNCTVIISNPSLDEGGKIFCFWAVEDSDDNVDGTTDSCDFRVAENATPAWWTEHKTETDVDDPHNHSGAAKPPMAVAPPGWYLLLLPDEVVNHAANRLESHNDDNEETNLLVTI